MPMFQNSQNTDARGATFNDVSRDQFNGVGQVNITYTNSADPLLEGLRPVPEAMYDSIGSISRCMEGTRQDIIGAIIAWMDGGNNKSICWLYGAAGSGKSAISRTIAERCAENDRLCGSFFFLRGAGRRSSITHFISTLAYNLAFFVPSTRPFIEGVVQRDPYILKRSLERQFQQLIADPVRSVTMPAFPMVFIIDALDECNDKSMIADFIEVVAHAIGHYRLPLRFFFTSRVEEHIRKPFSVSPTLPITNCFALEDFDADDDIHTFFQSRFSKIYQENYRVMRHITLPWPSESDLDELVEKSSGSFIFAFTLVNFVNDGSDLPNKKLQVALESHDGLDPLYTQVLHAAPRSPHLRRILETVMIIEDYLSITDLACLLGIEAGEVIHALLGVQSILIVPENDEQPVRPFHTSLRDFLTTQSRSNDLFVDPATRHLLIASDCLKSMADHSGGEFSERRGLKFASRRWCRHFLHAIETGGGDNPLFSQHITFMMDILTDFVSRSFDSWIDSLIIQRVFSEAQRSLHSVISTLKGFVGCPQNVLRMIEKIKAIAEV